MFNNLGNLADLMRNAGKIREQMESASETLGQVQVEGTAGGAVTAKVNGRLELLSVRIDPKLVAENDVELLEDLTTAAVNQAMVKAREAVAEHMQGVFGGMSLPPGLTNLFGGGGPGA